MGWIIYFAEVAGNLQEVFIASSIVTIIVAAVWSVGIGVMTDLGDNGDYSTPRKLLISAAIVVVIAALLPSSTTIYMIVGANIAEAQITSDEGQEIIGKVRQLVVQKLDDAIAEGAE